jgi:hypothetical protein
MTTATELANRALSHIGEMEITDISDTESKAARVCNGLYQSIIDETLREHRWNCAITRTALSEITPAPAVGSFDHAFQLPGDLLRLLEVNGEQYEGSDQFHEIENGRQLLTHATTVEIRYVKRIEIHEFDPLLAKAVAAGLAAAICIPLTKDTKMQAQLEALKARAISKAARIDAIEVGSREGSPLQRILQNSPLIQSRWGRRARRDPLHYYLP